VLYAYCDESGTHVKRWPEVAPKSMRRNDQGEVVGHLFECAHPALASFADWLEQFDGQ
jgi:hypothetical protein